MQSSIARTGLLVVFCLLALSIISTASAQTVNAGTTAEPAPILPDDEFEERLPSLDADAFTARPAPTTAEDPPALAEPLRSAEHTSELQSLMRISYAVF